MLLLNQIISLSKFRHQYLTLISTQCYEQQLITLFIKLINHYCYQQLLINTTPVSKSDDCKIQRV